ncbi:MAG: response regulator [Elusimicrobiota bacterium]
MMFTKQKKALIVDDEETVRNTASMIFKGWNLNVTVAEDGSSALNEVKKIKPDIILLDIQMPGIDGFEVCRILKTKRETRKIKIIMLTGLGKTFQVDRAFESGADDYVIKPVDWDRLKEKVSSLLKTKL